MHICIECGKEHDGSYGTGKFCSKHCRHVYIGKSAHKTMLRNNTNLKPHKAPYGRWKCPFCGLIFETRAQLNEHKKTEHNGKRLSNIEKKIYYCKYCNKEIRSYTKSLLTNHEKHCLKNPNRVPYKGHRHTEETKKIISEKMKIAHAEGRAGTYPTRKNCSMSYPERWFVEVAEREGITGFVRELKFYRFFLDFAWPEKKFCIEIDGEQHQRFENRKINDQEKDRLLKEEGWTEIRVSWSWLSKNVNRFIEAVKNNLNSLEDLDVNVLSLSYVNAKEKRKLALQKKRDEAKQNGTLASNGHLSGNKLSFEEWDKRKQLIENANVDLTKFGCIAKLIKLTGLSASQIRKTIKHFSMR